MNLLWAVVRQTQSFPKARRLILEGLVEVDGRVIQEPMYELGPGEHKITIKEARRHGDHRHPASHRSDPLPGR